MKLVYISGKYTDPRGSWYVHKNIEKAKEVARFFMLEGFAVICPHAMSAFMDCEQMGWSAWLAIDEEIVKRCDVVALLPDWENSKGAVEEKKYAEENGKTIWYVYESFDSKGIATYSYGPWPDNL